MRQSDFMFVSEPQFVPGIGDFGSHYIFPVDWRPRGALISRLDQHAHIRRSACDGKVAGLHAGIAQPEERFPAREEAQVRILVPRSTP